MHVQNSRRRGGKKVKNGLEQIKMAFVYASCDYDLDDMLAGIADELPGVPVIGNTSFTGVITPEGFVGGDDGFVGIMGMTDENLCVGVAAVEKRMIRRRQVRRRRLLRWSGQERRERRIIFTWWHLRERRSSI